MRSAPILRAYLKRWKAEVGVFFDGVGPDSSEQELRADGREAPGVQARLTGRRWQRPRPASLPSRHELRARADRSDRHRLRRPRHRGRLRRARQRGLVRRHRRREDRAAARAARCRSTSPAWTSCSRRNRGAAALLDRRSTRRSRTRGCCSSAVGTPPTYAGDADLSAVHAVVEAMPASDASTRS